MKNYLKDLVPPVLWRQGKKIERYASSIGQRGEGQGQGSGLPPPFKSIREPFFGAVASSKIYGEYGMGKSTVWVAENTSAEIRAVDTVQAWVDCTRKRIQGGSHTLTWVDVGPVGNWGMPLGYSRRDAFLTYVQSIWGGGDEIDTVLVDGRFRVACWLETVARARPGTRIIFDDYIGRESYRVIEEFVSPSVKTDRQALFVVPNKVDKELLTRTRDSFLMVRE